MNKIELEENGKKEKYDVILSVEAKDKNKYILYTKGEKNDLGDVIVYAGLYKENNKNISIEPILDDDILENLDTILTQVQRQAKKEVGE